MIILDRSDLPHGEAAYRFEGYQFGNVAVSFFIINAPVGRGPDLHTHPYPEVFVIEEGDATFTIGDDTIPAAGGQIVIVPASAPHRFINTGKSILRMISIHPTKKMAQVYIGAMGQPDQ